MDAEEQVVPEAVSEGAFGRVLGALFSPRATFQSIANKPSWLVPVLLVVALNLVLVASFSHRVGWRPTIEKQLEGNARFTQLSPQQQERQINLALRLAPMELYVGALLGTPIVLLILAAVFLGAFNVIFGTSINFSQSFAVNAYAGMAGAVKILLAILIVWVRPPQGVDIQHLVMSNVGAFLPAGSPLWQTTPASLVDVFALWSIVLMAIGYAAASGKRIRFGGALGVIVALWLAFMLVVGGGLALFA